MKDTHLIIALYRALDRYGTTALPPDDAERTERGRGDDRGDAWHDDRRRSPGWVSVPEIEASQSPNTYPRLTRRAIRARCEALAHEDASPVRVVEKRPGRLRTWVLVAPPGDGAGAAGGDAATATAAPADAGDEARRSAHAPPSRRAPADAHEEGTAGAADDEDADAETARERSATVK